MDWIQLDGRFRDRLMPGLSVTAGGVATIFLSRLGGS